MHVSKLKEKLLRRPSAQVPFSKLNAVLEKTKAFAVVSQQAESTQSYETAERCRARQLEAEFLKAQAEAYAQNLRRRFV